MKALGAFKNPHTSHGNFWSELPGVAKVAIIGGALVGIYISYKAINRAIEVSKEKKGLNTEKDELKQLNNQGIKQSFPDSMYITWADTLKKNLNGCTNDPLLIIGVITKMKNDADWLKLVEAFGTTQVEGCMLASNRTVSLQAALNWKLDTVYVKMLNDQWFKAKGSKYRL